jgi:hypothetical protein
MVLPVTVAAWLSPEQFSKQAFQQRAEVTDAAALGQRPAKSRGNALSEPPTSEQTPPATSSQPGAQTAGASVTPVPPSLAESAPTGSVPTATPPAAAPAAPGNEAIPDYLQKTAEGYIVAEVLDLLYAVQDSQLRKDFEGRTVQLIAQMMPGGEKGAASADSSAPTRFKAVRMFMTCCAADARPVSTLVEAKTLPELPEMTWVKIVGKATFPLENGKRVGVLQATSVEQTKPPEEAMLF